MKNPFMKLALVAAAAVYCVSAHAGSIVKSGKDANLSNDEQALSDQKEAPTQMNSYDSAQVSSNVSSKVENNAAQTSAVSSKNAGTCTTTTAPAAAKYAPEKTSAALSKFDEKAEALPAPVKKNNGYAYRNNGNTTVNSGYMYKRSEKTPKINSGYMSRREEKKTEVKNEYMSKSDWKRPTPELTYDMSGRRRKSVDNKKR